MLGKMAVVEDQQKLRAVRLEALNGVRNSRREYQRSPSTVSATKLFPSLSMAVTRAWPYSMMAHSAALCQCSSRTPPAVNLMSTPASVVEMGSSRTVTSCDHPPSYIRLCAIENGYLNCGIAPASEIGGNIALGLRRSSSTFVGPGSLAASRRSADLALNRSTLPNTRFLPLAVPGPGIERDLSGTAAVFLRCRRAQPRFPRCTSLLLTGIIGDSDCDHICRG